MVITGREGVWQRRGRKQEGAEEEGGKKWRRKKQQDRDESAGAKLREGKHLFKKSSQ